MTEDELEIAVLEKYIQQYEHIEEGANNKCAYELDMKNVLQEILGNNVQDLEAKATQMHNRLAPRSTGLPVGVLKHCSNGALMNSEHKHHARAFKDPINQLPSLAWDRISELKQQQEKAEELLILKPGIFGFGVNLREAWRRAVKFRKK